MIRIRIEDLKRFCDLKENEVVKGADGETYYTVTRQGDSLIIEESRAKMHPIEEAKARSS